MEVEAAVAAVAGEVEKVLLEVEAVGEEVEGEVEVEATIMEISVIRLHSTSKWSCTACLEPVTSMGKYLKMAAMIVKQELVSEIVTAVMLATAVAVV
jgi:hypothetical protein